jgi:hypothetical protein
VQTEAALVIPFETAATAEVEQQDNGHYLIQGQTARRKPGSFFVPWQTMGLAIGFKSLTKVIDITIDSGYRAPLETL